MSDELADLKPGAREEEDQKDEQDEQDDATELDEQQQAELNQKLLSAAANGELEEALELCQQGANPAYQEPNEGVSPLMKASECGHIEVVAMLLEAGAPWNAQDHNGYTAGEYAMGLAQEEVVDLLMDFGVQAELLLGALTRRLSHQSASTSSPAAVNNDYLQQRLRYEGEVLLDADGEAVMMGWERPLMLRHAERISAKPGARVLNVGFGLGIVDTALQSHSPSHHTIIEAHPDVHAHMLAKGWGEKPNVTILFGRWQDMVEQGKLGQYDGIFFDTYGEYYDELREFHKLLPKILAPGGVYSYFNGLAPDNIFFHMVYNRLVQLELQSLGLSTHYEPLSMEPLGDEVWQGVRNKYWHFEQYFLPVCKHDPKLLDGADGDQ